MFRNTLSRLSVVKSLRNNLALIQQIHLSPSCDNQDLFVPTPKARPGESTELKRARLLYQSRKRGMLENGLLLSTFAAKYLATFDSNQLQVYDDLINKPSNEWDIYYWATDVKPTPSEYVSDIMTLFKAHVRNGKKETRFFQPDL